VKVDVDIVFLGLNSEEEAPQLCGFEKVTSTADKFDAMKINYSNLVMDVTA
jgi:hypothetical protein